MDGAQICIGDCFGRFCIEPEYGRPVGMAANGQYLLWGRSRTVGPAFADVHRGVDSAELLYTTITCLDRIDLG
jgi:hypothetical protein